MGFRKDFRELISFFSNRPKGYIPDQESVGANKESIRDVSLTENKEGSDLVCTPGKPQSRTPQAPRSGRGVTGINKHDDMRERATERANRG